MNFASADIILPPFDMAVNRAQIPLKSRAFELEANIFSGHYDDLFNLLATNFIIVNISTADGFFDFNPAYGKMWRVCGPKGRHLFRSVNSP